MEKARVLITFNVSAEARKAVSDALDKDALLVFAQDVPDTQRHRALSESEVLISANLSRELSQEDLSSLDRLRFVQFVSAGIDHALPKKALPSRVQIASNSGAYAEPIAEHIIAMTLCLAKRLVIEHGEMVRGNFNQFNENRLMKGRTCGILGFGGIGRATAPILRALGMRIHAINTSGESEEKVEFIGTLRDLDYVLSSSDVILVSLPLNNKTRGLLGKRELDLMKPDAILINVARGEIIDEDALYDHLGKDPQFLAGIESWWVEPVRHDVFEIKYPFPDLPNVLACPHNSAMVPGIMLKGIVSAAENVRHFLNNEQVRGLIDPSDYYP